MAPFVFICGEGGSQLLGKIDQLPKGLLWVISMVYLSNKFICMKKALFSIILWFSISLSAQTYINIPDAGFAAWLQSNFPAAMSGNQLNITNSAITSCTIALVSNKSIHDLTGIQYFTSLQRLECGTNYLSSLPALPTGLLELYCQQNALTTLPSLPMNLKVLHCDNNLLTVLPSLPNTITSLGCNYNYLTSLPQLPLSLDSLFCASDSLPALPVLPSTLRWLECEFNKLTNLPSLPASLEGLGCMSNLLTSIPSLPNNLLQFDCSNNPLTLLPTLPPNLTFLGCSNNPLTILPTLPLNLTFLICDSIGLNSLPTLPPNLKVLSCEKNNLTNLPLLPSTLQSLMCGKNQLTSLPNLPNLIDLDCSQNQITCLPILPVTINGVFNFSGNLFNCLPNYIPYMSPQVLNIPLCSSGNTNGCQPAGGILGYIYTDLNSDCLFGVGDNPIKNIPLKLYDSNNNLVGQTISSINGIYNFAKPNATYKVVIDTSYLPIKVQCAHPGSDTMVLVNGLDSNVNFTFNCKSGFDLGVEHVNTIGVVFPGQTHTLVVNAGGFSNWYGMNCASGIAGLVQVQISGPVIYVSPSGGALTPTISGNSFVYQVADFGSINNSQDFNLVIKTDTTAQLGDSICVDIIITPFSGDINPTNNNYHVCYSVVNSLDPNIKEVYPVGVPVGYRDWFTYTIHFQNTGSAPAMNIRLVDTLDNNLDLSTFKVTGYSSPCNPYLNGKFLTVYYPNIMLPDSSSNPNGSIGYFQYKIKPKTSWQFPTQIKNRADIYFDFNPAVLTNTTLNYFLTAVSVSENSKNSFRIYPNPNTGKVNIEGFNIIEEISVFDLMGRSILNSNPNSIRTSFENLDAGCYLVFVKIDGMVSVQRMIVK